MKLPIYFSLLLSYGIVATACKSPRSDSGSHMASVSVSMADNSDLKIGDTYDEAQVWTRQQNSSGTGNYDDWHAARPGANKTPASGTQVDWIVTMDGDKITRLTMAPEAPNSSK